MEDNTSGLGSSRSQPSELGPTGLSRSEAEPSAGGAKLKWWWSRDDERFYGPSYSRADAIMDAWADDPDAGAFICQASQQPWHSGVMHEDHLMDLFDEANEDLTDPDGDLPSATIPEGVWKDLTKRMNSLVREAVRRAGVMSWGFAAQRPSEWVDIGKMWAAAEAAISEPADPDAKATGNDAPAGGGGTPSTTGTEGGTPEVLRDRIP